MITFIPSWNSNTNEEVRDDLIGVIRSFMEANIEHQVIILDYIPELRYFLHRYGLLETQYINLFDYLQGFNDIDQYFLTLEELHFPEDVHYVYTPFHILVYERELLIGKIFFGRGSQVSEVYHFKNGELSYIEIYDDRGILSSCKVFDRGKFSYIEYLDSEEKWVICQLSSQEVLVNPHNRRGLIKDKYANIQELIFELLNNQFKKGKNSEKIIYSLTDENFSYLNLDHFSSNIILSIYGNRFTKMNILEPLVMIAKAILLDSYARIEQISPYLSKDKMKKLHIFPPYDTRLNLSHTQEMKEEILFFELKSLSGDEIQTILKSLLNYLINILMQPNNERIFKVYFHVESEIEKENILKKLENIYLGKFSEEVINLNFEDNKGENEINSFDLSLIPAEYKVLKQLRETFDIKINLFDEELFEVLHESRLIIDLSSKPDLFLQMAAISSGLPQVNLIKTEYIDEGKNGIILREIGMIGEALSYYLDYLKHWQQARMYAVQKIKKYSGITLTKKLIKLLTEDNHG